MEDANALGPTVIALEDMTIHDAAKPGLLWEIEEQDGRLTTKPVRKLVGQIHYLTVKYCV